MDMTGYAMGGGGIVENDPTPLLEVDAWAVQQLIWQGIPTLQHLQ